MLRRRTGPFRVAVACRAELWTALARMIASGIPLGRALECVSNGALRHRFARATPALGTGMRVAAALRDAGAIEPGAHHPVVSAGEEAGRLEDGVRRVAELERERLQGALELAADWLPRVV